MLETLLRITDKSNEYLIILNMEQNINPNIFNKDIELSNMRKGFGDGLVDVAKSNENIIGLCADLSDSTYMNAFKEKFPERYVEVGVAEQNLVTVASGMAAMGKIPFVASYAIFSPGRNWEQIRTTICYNNQPVKIIGTHVGVTVGPDGGSHQALEDIALMRVLPRMVVISPCDEIEAKKATIAMSKTLDPSYMRLSRDKTSIITTTDSPFEIGKANIFYKSNIKKIRDVCIFATGSIVYEAIMVARSLESKGVSVSVVNISTIKPLDEDLVIRMAHESKAVVTVEDHQITGGLGGAISECLSANYPVPIEFIGVKDMFGQSGEPNELRKYYELDSESIEKAVRRVMLRKK